MGINKETILRLAQNVDSPDLLESRDAVRDLKAMLPPSAIVTAMEDEAQAAVFVELLDQAQASGGEKVMSVVMDILRAVLDDTRYGDVFITSRHAHPVLNFIIRTITGEATGVALKAYEPVLSILHLAVDSDGAQVVAPLLEAQVRSDKLLRLFNVDDVFSENNTLVYTFLRRYTTLVDFLYVEASAAFANDPLLLANYLIVCGIFARHEDLPAALANQIHLALQSPEQDSVVFINACHFCSIVLHKHEQNAVKHATEWVPLAAAHLSTSSPECIDAICTLLGAAVSTKAGWRIVHSTLSPNALAVLLQQRTLDSVRLSVLRFLSTALSVDDVCATLPNTVVTNEAMQEVWRLRTTPDVTLRIAVWEVLACAVKHQALRDILAPLCASFLCGQPNSEGPALRDLQRQVASTLIAQSSLPASTKHSLETFVRKGLYPPGSAGVASLRRD